MMLRDALLLAVLAAAPAFPPALAASAEASGSMSGHHRLLRASAAAVPPASTDDLLALHARRMQETSEETGEEPDADDPDPNDVVALGENYCTYSPDEECYASGWPACCVSGRCPIERPPCDVTATTTTTTTTFTTTTTSTQEPPGTSYCTYSPDTGCYASGWPACCEVGRCPIDIPPCDITTTTTYTTTTTTTPEMSTTTEPPADPTTPVTEATAPTASWEPPYCKNQPDPCCYPGGLPECCLDPSVACPAGDAAPPCTAKYDPGANCFGGQTEGPAYCTAPADYACYAGGQPDCCLTDIGSCISGAPPPCEIGSTTTSSTSNYAEIPVGAFPPLELPAGGLRACGEVIPNFSPDDIVPPSAVQNLINAGLEAIDLGEFATTAALLAAALPEYGVRARKVCGTCEEANEIYEKNNACADCDARVSAGDAMPYCEPGSFAAGRTMSGLLLEPIDMETGMVASGNLATTVYSYPTETNPFLARSELWPRDPADMVRMMDFIGPLSAASSGNVVLVPDVLGNGEDWQGMRSYIVKTVYQASAVPLLLKVRDGVATEHNGCTNLDGRLNIVGYSEGGYASISIMDAVDELGEDWVHAYTGVGGAPIRLSTANLYAAVEMDRGTYPFPQFMARIGNAYSSTNQDLSNTNIPDTDIQQPIASEEYLDDDDETKDLRDWAEAGLSYGEMVPYMPGPPYGAGKQSDLINPDLLSVILQTFEAGGDDPCNSDFVVGLPVDKACEAIKQNDVLDIIQNVDYPVQICHSADDEVVFYTNIPDVEANENLSMIEDVPLIGEFIRPRGGHGDAGFQCALGFLLPWTTVGSEVRAVKPIDDPEGACVVTTTSSTTTSAGPNAVAPGGGSGPGSTVAAGTKGPTSAPTPPVTTEPVSAASGLSAVAGTVVALFVSVVTYVL